MDFIITYNYVTINGNFVGKITINGVTILLDLDDLFKIINSSKKFNQYEPGCVLPYFKRNNHKVTYREFLFGFSSININFEYKNGNSLDLRKSNVTIYHEYHDYVISNYNYISYQQGHLTKYGKDAFVMKNPLWIINENNKKIILMYCEKNTLIKLCEKSYEAILNNEKEKGKKHTFFIHSNGYICSTSGLFIHQIITGCYGNGKGTMNVSVDHIDQNPLNNTYSNLRIATRKEQEENSNGIKEGTKRARKKNAKRLPEGITQDMLPKYVYYCKECYNKEKQLFREFFRIEKHPNMTKKQIAGSKSQKLTIHEKLEEIKEKLATLS